MCWAARADVATPEILLIDDEPTIRLSLGTALTDAGYAVTLASDGHEGLDHARSRRFDTVVTDVRLPGIDGMTLFRRLRAECPGLDVILITAHGEVSDAVDAVKAGAADYLLKPFAPEELILRLERLAAHRTLRAQLDAARVALADRLGPYTLERQIGAGGMGQVYRATHAMLRRPTALKLLRGSGEAAVERFEREVQQTCRLTHPNTVAIYDYGRTPEGVFYYAMELLDGCTLGDLIAADGRLPPGRAIHLLRQVCGSLAEAHAAGLVHRDIKPSNVHVGQRGGIHDFVKVLDFGLVTVAGASDGGASGAEEQAFILGTPGFIAPELVDDPHVATPAADVYSVGVVAYELLAGRPPYACASITELFDLQATTPPDPPSMHADLPADLEELVLRCMAVDPKERPDVLALERALAACSSAGEWSGEQARAWWRTHGSRLRGVRQARSDKAHTRVL